MKEVGRYSYRDAHRAAEFVADLAEGEEIVLRWDLARIAGGKGWRTTEDAGGYTVVTELSPEECDVYLARRERSDVEASERDRDEEAQRRERSRQAREMAQPSTRAPR